jgi:hypothetical protein
LLDALRAGVVGGQGFDQVEVVALEQFAEVAGSGFDVGLRVKGIVHAQLGGGLGHELHQSLRAFGREGADVEAAFGADDAGDQVGIELVGAAGGFYGCGQVEGMSRGGGFGGGVVGCDFGGRVFGKWSVRHVFEVVDLGGGDVDEAGWIVVDVEAGGGADGFAALVEDGESVAQDGGIGGVGARG